MDSSLPDEGLKQMEDTGSVLSQIMDLKTAVARSTEAIEKAVVREVAKTLTCLSPWVIPTVRIGNKNVPLREIDPLVMTKERQLVESMKEVNYKNEWIVRVEKSRNQYYEVIESQSKEILELKKEITDLKTQAAEFNVRVAANESEHSRTVINLKNEVVSLRQTVQAERDEVNRLRREMGGGDGSSQRLGYF